MMGTTELTIAGLVAVGIAASALLIPPAKHVNTEAVQLLLSTQAAKPIVNTDEVRLDAVQENLELQSDRIQKLNLKLDALMVVKEPRNERRSGERR
jgi:hypothetical protein